MSVGFSNKEVIIRFLGILVSMECVTTWGPRTLGQSTSLTELSLMDKSSRYSEEGNPCRAREIFLEEVITELGFKR